MNVRFPPYTESNKKLMKKLLKFGSVTYDQLFKVLFGIILLIALIVGASIIIPKLNEA